MNEAKARDICSAEGDKLLVYSRDELAAADKWVKGYALGQLVVYLRSKKDVILANYVLTMVRHTYGTAETDQFLKDTHCYPEWLQ